MSTPSGRKSPVDYGVQIRFINDSGGGLPSTQLRSKPPSTSKYGVAVRVQGIAGQPYVVMKDGGPKGDSYGVQLRTHYPPGYGSLPRRRDREEGGGEGEGGEGQGGALRRAQSHGSLLESEGGGGFGRPPGDGRSGSYGNLDGGIGVAEERTDRGVRDGGMGRNIMCGSYQSGLNGSLGRGGGSQYAPDLHPSQTEQPPLTMAHPHPQSHPYPAQPHPQSLPYPAQLHPQSLPYPAQPHPQTPVNRLISRFDGSSSTREQQRGRSPVAEDPRDTISPSLAPNPYSSSSPSLTPNPYSSPPSSTHSSLGRGQGSISKATPHPANQRAPPGRFVAVETPSANRTDPLVTPDLLLQSSEVTSEEEQVMQTIYSVLREGTSESDSVIRHKVWVIFQKIQGLKPSESSGEEWRREKRDLERKMMELQTSLQEERRGSVGSSDPVLKAELESCLDENMQLQETVDRAKTELHQTHSELSQLRMARESAESRVREMEDRLVELQEELRTENCNKTDLVMCQASLSEVSMLKQKLEDSLRQRERELTALKGALKDEVATHDKEIETLREQYSTDMERLRSTMEQVSQSQAGIESERLRVNASVRTLQQQLEDCRDESGHWMTQFHSTRDELRTTKQEMLQARLEKEELEEELNEVQERVNTMKQQIPDPSHTHTLNQELQSLRADLQQAQSEAEKKRVELDKKVMEVISLKKTNQEQEAELKYEMDRLRGQSNRAKEDLAKAQERTKQLPDPSVVSGLQSELTDARGERDRLGEKLSSTEQELQSNTERLARTQTELNALRDSQQEQEAANTRLREKLSRLESQLASSASESSEAELSLQAELRGLRQELDEARRGASRLGQDHRQLSLRLEEREKERDQLTQTNTQLEEQRRQQERSLDNLNKEFESLSQSSGEEVQVLRAQLEEQRERSRRETQEAQRQGNDRLVELERSQTSLKRLEEEASRLKKELLSVVEERDNVQLDKELLTNRLHHLEAELENSRSSLTDKSRELRSTEDKMKRLELELEEEKGSVELLTDRVTRTRDQMEQLRSELMQERSSRQDLELDKNALERHMKELKTRVSDMEGQSRSSVGVAQLESKVHELEERLHSEDREKNSMLSSQRRLEKKLKELNFTLEEERQQHTEQRDQLSLRVKALKRQVDEGETEVERMEGLRRKAQREMEEQMELKEALQGRVTVLETELKRKVQQAQRQALDSSALSSDEDDEALYDPSSITSILTGSNLHTSSC
ncbi:cingulin isoform X1 [Salmo trutta]|uniref:Cingulin n=1 Tax=Salmo trutta TaxID=8032 RepID=A0A674EGS5_SALTR|nr:cingulin-like isoform X1 [Salmo trutta]XP_029593197.1 cingulin-like isoform X1 [Salmo trutta]